MADYLYHGSQRINSILRLNNGVTDTIRKIVLNNNSYTIQTLMSLMFEVTEKMSRVTISDIRTSSSSAYNSVSRSMYSTSSTSMFTAKRSVSIYEGRWSSYSETISSNGNINEYYHTSTQVPYYGATWILSQTEQVWDTGFVNNRSEQYYKSSTTFASTSKLNNSLIPYGTGYSWAFKNSSSATYTTGSRSPLSTTSSTYTVKSPAPIGTTYSASKEVSGVYLCTTYSVVDVNQKMSTW